ncbi:EAL domain-containing protein [Roseibium salinum]|uniref:EAL domain-containing protein n=1 Tax=Roseibium salinum TaxID=1604349 RepID=A0ABT3R1N6_9HYPH|nr:EAL domain-containing protein [Roseibium sp. DSM 29163]MCX2723123.1 EAL domain-containing protein [Roseibium sp. DSM 29163]
MIWTKNLPIQVLFTQIKDCQKELIRKQALVLSFRYVGFAKTVLIALVLATAPLFAINIILDQYAERRAITEMEAMGNVSIRRAEEAISTTVTLLQRLDRDNVQTCSAEDRVIFEKQIVAHGMIDAIGLADASGQRMCIIPDRELAGQVILPQLRMDGPLVGIGMLERGYLGARAAVISWDLKDRTRLFAEVTPAVIAIDPGPEYLRSYRRAELRLGDNLLWYSVGGYNSEGSDPEEMLSVEIASQLYPLAATVTAPVSSARQLVNDLKVVAVAACGGIAVLLVAVGVWLSWRPESEANDEFVAAIRNGEFIPYYQPVMDIETNRLRGCEVLMRWRRPNGMIVSPGQFMAYAENNGHIFDMTRHMMRVSVDEVGELYGENPDLKLSINLFAGHFLDREIVADIKSIFGKSAISFQQIVVEVTERHPLEDMDLARKIIAELQALGVRVALDDVGTGHGGMAYLQKLGVDIIKIDKMFIDTIGSDDNSTTIVDSMVELADNLGMGIIAEGVELEEQIERLLELGVTAAQGYHFAQPMPAEDFIAFAERTEKEADERDRLAAEAAAAERAASKAVA